MALTRFSGDADVISQLSDQPNDNDGLSATQLKAKFDQFGATFKQYLNETLIPELESAINAAATGIGTSGFSGAIITDGTIMSEKLSSTNGVEAVRTAVVRDAAITKPKLALDVQSTLDSVASKTTHKDVSVTLLAASWSDNQQTVTVSGVKTNNVVRIDPAEDDTSYEAWVNCQIRSISQSTNSLTFKCRSAPSSDVTVNVLILD